MNLSDPKDCLYCQNNQTLHELMIEIAPLSVSRLFLFKEQTYRGRCLVAYKDHVHDLNMLSDEERNAFMADVVRVTRAMQKIFNPQRSITALIRTNCRTFISTWPRNMKEALTSAGHLP